MPRALSNTLPKGLFLALVLFALPVEAAVFVVPEDADLVRDADAIVVARVSELNGRFAGERGIETDVDLEIETILKSHPDLKNPLRVVEAGGLVGERFHAVSGSANYWPSDRSLIFLQRTAEGNWRTYGMSLGKFDFVKDSAGRGLAIRWLREHDIASWSPQGIERSEPFRDSAKFMAFIRAEVRGPRPRKPVIADAHDPASEHPSPASGDYVVDVAPDAVEALRISSDADAYPPSAYTQGTFRWDVFDKGGSVTFRSSGTQPGYDAVGASQKALAAWTNDPGSNVNYMYGGTTTAAFVQDSTNAIVFNSANDVPAGSVAYAQWFGGAIHTYKGESFYSITEGDVVVRSGISMPAKTFEEAVTHELGHTLGFRHSEDRAPASAQAVMKAILSGNYGASLGPWDIDAVRTVYTDTASVTLPAPTNVVATATASNRVVVTWAAVSGATQYAVLRSPSISAAFVQIGVSSTTSYTDMTVAANTTYLYKVRALGSSVTSADSVLDHATTVIFTDDPLTTSTPVKAVHLAEIRTALNAVRAAAALGPASWTDAAVPGVRVKAVHITEMRAALSPALAALGKTAVYSDPSLGSGTPIRAIHFQELRNFVK